MTQFKAEENSETQTFGIDFDYPEAPLLGRYTDLGPLGVGGMGEVRKVHDPTLKRDLAMKILHPRLMVNEQIVSRFIEEAQIGAQLQHPNIIPVYEIGQLPDDRHYFTMQEIKGTEFTLHIQAVHRASDKLRWRAAPDGTTFRDLIQIFHQVCVTISYAHSLGVVHRDLKPDNIMIGGFGDVLVVDWGLAKILGRTEEDWAELIESDRSSDEILLTRMGSIAGTPAYMSPEQAAGQTDKIGLGTDIYTLGAILYELLSGRPPYIGRSSDEIVQKVRSTPPPSLRTSPSQNGDGTDEVPTLKNLTPPESQPSKLPGHLISICERAMQRDIGKRYAKAEELAGAVRGWLEGVEKREKALKEVEAARLLLERALSQDLLATEKWCEANSITESAGMASASAWELWSEARSAQANARRIRRSYLRQLEGALVHDPELEEAHQILAELRIDQLVDASAVGDIQAREVHSQQIQTHLKFLPLPSRARLEEVQEQRLKDVISGQRARRGALVGRQEHRTAITAQIYGGDRLITLVGTAGVGKTRLVLELAQDLRETSSRAVFCDLTEATDTLGIARLISRAMDVRLRDTDPIAYLAEVLAKQPTLLVLDNLEQVVKTVGPICQDWVTALPDLRILATSRTRLGVPAETVVPLKPLTLLESAELFARRGQTAAGRFELNADNRDLVCDLVQKLDGLPLAIELAAARLNTLSLHEIAERLSSRFKLLRSRRGEGKALAGALDWSWDLLESWEKAALSQVSIFHGGFNLSAAESVVDVSSWTDCPAMFEILAELSDDSLLQKNPAEDGTVRYGMLESIRAYAAGKLGTSGGIEEGCSGPEAMGEAQRRHAAHFAHMGDPAYLSALDSFESAGRWVELFQELDNLVAAIDYGTNDTAPRCSMAALKVLGMKGPVSLGVDIAGRVLKLPKLSRRLKMQLEIERSKCLRISGRMDEAREVVRISVSDSGLNDDEAITQEGKVIDPGGEESVEASEPSTDSLEPSITDTGWGKAAHRAERLQELGHIELRQSNFDAALRCYQEVLDICRSQGDRIGEGRAAGNLGIVYREQGQYERAVELYTQAIDIAREHGNKSREGIHLGNLGTVYRDQGQPERAIEFYTQALDIARELGNRRNEGSNLGNLGNAYLAQGQYEQAVELYTQTVDIARETGDKRVEGAYIGNLGNVYRIQAEYERATQFLTQAIDIARELGNKRSEGIHLGNLGDVYKAQGQAERAVELYTQAIDIARGIGDRRTEGINLGGLGDVYSAQRQPERAIEFFTQAISLCDEASPADAGAFRGSLAWLLAQQDQIEKAHTLLETGEAQVETDRQDHAKFLCKKGQVQLLVGNAASAQASLEQAHGIAAELDASDENELGRAITQLREALSDTGSEPGEESTVDLDPLKSRITGTSIPTAVLQADGLVELGNIAWHEGHYDQAQRHTEDALAIYREHGNRHGEGRALGNLGNLFQIQGQTERAIEFLEQAISTHRSIGNRRSEGISLGNLGDAYRAQGEHEHAVDFLTQALDIHREIGSKSSEGAVLGNLGDALVQLQRFDEAESAFRDAIPIADETYPAFAGAFRGSLALLLAAQDQFDEAQALLEAGELQVQSSPEEYAKFLCKKAHVQHLAGQAENAQASLSQAQDIAKELKLGEDSEVVQVIAQLLALLQEPDPEGGGGSSGSELGEGSTADLDPLKSRITGTDIPTAVLEAERLIELGKIEYEQGHHDEALRCYEAALDIFQEHGDRSGEGRVLGSLGAIFYSKGQYDRAVELHTDAIDILREVGNKRDEAEVLNNLGNALECQGHYDRAIGCYTTAIDIFRELGDKRNEGSALGNLGNAHLDQGEYDRAIECYTSGIDSLRQVGDKRSEGIHLGNLGLAYAAQGKHERAVEFFTESIDIAREVSDKRLEGMNTGNLGDALLRLGRLEEAEAAFRQALSFIDGQTPMAAGAFRGSLALLLAMQAQFDEAQALLEVGEAQITGNPEEYAKFLCKKGQVQRLAGDAGGARASLEQARVLAAELNVTDESEVGQAIAELEALLGHSGPDGGEDGGGEPGAASELGEEEDLASLEAVLSDGPEEASDEERGLALVEAERLMELGNIEHAEANNDKALRCFKGALHTFQKHGDRTGEESAIVGLGDVYRTQGQYERAIEFFTQALDIALEIGNNRSEAINLGNLANVYQAQGQYERAIELYTQALAIDREIGAKSGEGIHLGNLGNVYQTQGQYVRASELHTQALAIAREIGNKRLEGINLGNLANVYRAQGQDERAMEFFTQALDIDREIGNKRSEGIHLGNLANVYRKQGQDERAIETYTQALDIDRETGNKSGEGINLGNLGNAYQTQGQYERASELYTQALDIARENGNKRSEGINLGNLGEALVRMNRLDEAESAFRQAIPICDEAVPLAAGAFRGSLALLLAKQAQFEETRTLLETGELQVTAEPHELAKLLSKKGQVCHLAGDADGARASLEQARVLAAELNVTDESEVGQAIAELEAVLSEGPEEGSDEDRDLALVEAERLMELGSIEADQSNYDEALHSYQGALDIFRRHGDRTREGLATGALGAVHHAQGQYERAIELYTQAIDIAREIGNKRSEGMHLGNLGGVYKTQGQDERAIEYLTQAIDIAREIGNKRFEGMHLGNLGNVYQAQGQDERAIEFLTQAIGIAREIGDRRFEGIHLGNLGLVNQAQGQHERAMEHLTQAHDIAKKIGDRRLVGINLGNLGDALFSLERVEEAENAFRQAIPIGDETFPVAAGAFRGSLALLLAQQAQFEETRTLLEAGEPVVESYPEEHAKFLCKKGLVQHLAGDADGARASLEQARVLAAELNVSDDSEIGRAIAELEAVLGASGPDGGDEGGGESISDPARSEEAELALLEAERLRELGNIEREQSNLDEAKRCYEGALDLFRAHGYRSGEGIILGKLGAICRARGQHERAIDLYTQALDIHREVGDKNNEGYNLGNLGNVFFVQGQFERATTHYKAALSIHREVGSRIHEGNILGNLGNVVFAQGQLEDAIGFYTAAIDILREVGGKRDEGVFLGNLGNIYRMQGQQERAMELYTAAIDISKESGDKRHEGTSLGNLGGVLFVLGRVEEAEVAFKRAILLCDEALPAAAGAFRGYLALLLAHQDQHDDAHALIEAGEPQITSDPEEHGKFLCKKGQVQLLAGNAEDARASLKQALALAAELEVGEDSELARAVAELKGVLGDSGPDVGDADAEAPGAAPERSDDEDLAILEADRLMEMGNIELAQSSLDAAFLRFQEAFVLFRRHGDRRGEGRALGNIGSVFVSQGRHERAKGVYAQAIDIHQEVGNRQHEAITLGNLGVVFSAQGQHERATEIFTQAIEIAREVGDKLNEGVYLGNLGDALFELQRLDEAEANFRQAISIGDDTLPGAASAFRGSLALLLAQQDQFDEAHALLETGEPQLSSQPIEHAKFLCKKGQVQFLAGAATAARASLRQAQRLADELEFGEDSDTAVAIADLVAMLGDAGEDGADEDGEVWAPDPVLSEEDELELLEADRLLGLGAVEQNQGNYDEALRCFEKALEIFRTHGSRAREGHALSGLGSVFKCQGLFERAIEVYTTASDISQEVGDKHSQATTLCNLGVLFSAEGQHERAMELYTQALAIAKDGGDNREEGRILGNLGNLVYAQGQPERAIELYTEAIDIFREVGDKLNKGIFLGNLGDALLVLRRRKEAEVAFSQALSLCDGNIPAAAGAFRGSLALLLAQRDQLDEAHALLETGEPQLSSHHEEHAKFLCKKGQVQLLANTAENARASLKQAQGIAKELEVGEDSELAQDIAELVALLGASAPDRGAENAEAPGAAPEPSKETELDLIEAERLIELGHIEREQSHLDQALACYQEALDLFRRVGNRPGEGRALGRLGNVFDAMSQRERAIELFTEAIEIHREVGDKHSEAIAFGNLAGTLRFQGQYERAIEFFTRAVDIHRELGDKRSEGIETGNLANISRAQGRYENAIGLHMTAIAIHREVGDRRSEGIQTGNLGNVYQAQGQHERAIELYTSAIEIHREVGDRCHEGIFLGNLGEALFQLQRLEEAEPRFRQAISIGDDTLPAAASAFRAGLALLLAQKDQFDEAHALLETGEPEIALIPEEHAKFLCKKGQVQHLAGDAEGASTSLEQVRAMAADLKGSDESEVGQAIRDLEAVLGDSGPDGGDDEDRDLALIDADRLMELGNIEREQSHFDEAAYCYQSALDIFRRHGDRTGEGRATGNLGSVYQALGQYERSDEFYTQGVDIAREVGNKLNEGSNLGNLGNAYLAQGQYKRALESFTQAIDIAREIGNKRGEGILLGNLGSLYHAQGQYDRAVALYTQALDSARKIGDKRTEGMFLGNLGEALFRMERLDEAESAFRQAIPICDETVPLAAGVFRGSLALLLAQQGQIEEAQSMLEAGEAPVEPVPEEHAKFLCKKGQVCHISGDAEGARAALELAETLATELKVTDESEVRQAIRDLEAVLGDSGPDGGDDGGEAPGTDPVLSEEAELELMEAGRLMELGRTEHEQSNHDEAIRCFEAALDIFRRHGHRVDEGRALGNIGNIIKVLGQFDRAIELFTAAIDIHREVGNKRSEGRALGNLGNVFRAQGHHERAIEIFTASIDIHRKVGDTRSEGISIGNLGSVRVAQGQYGRAIELFTSAIDMHRKVGDKRNEGGSLGNLAYALFKLRRFDEAEVAFRLAIPIGDETFPLAAGAFRVSLALLLAQQDQLDEAHELIEKGEPQVTPSPEEHAKFLCKKGQVQFIDRQHDAAEDSLAEARAIAEALPVSESSELAQHVADLEALLIGKQRGAPAPSSDSLVDLDIEKAVTIVDGLWAGPSAGGTSSDPVASYTEEEQMEILEAERLQALGQIERTQSNFDEAMHCFSRAIEIHQRHGNRKGVASALISLSKIHQSLSNLDEATENITRALRIMEEIGELRMMSNALQALGNIHLTCADHDAATECYQRALEISEQTGDLRFSGSVVGNLAIIHHRRGDLIQAIEFFSRALDIATDFGEKTAQAVTLGNLGNVYRNQGRIDKALEHYHRSIEISRDLGDRFHEGASMGNLGDAYIELNRYDEAATVLQETVDLLAEISPIFAGAARGSLAMVLAREGKLEAAQHLIELGENQVEIHREEHGKFLCRKGHVHLMNSQPDAAQDVLTQAKTIAAELAVGEHTTLARAIAELEVLLPERTISK